MLKEVDSSPKSAREGKTRLKEIRPESEAAARPLVLVVDDDPAVLEIVSTYLKLEGYQTTHASNADEAVLRARSNPPEAVVLDVLLPGEDGFKVCKRLREDPATSRSVILLLSALDRVDSRVHGLQAGADDFLTKPFDPSELAARLQAHIRRMKNQEEKEKTLEQLTEKLVDMNRKLEQEAATDSLTELYNRRYFWKRLEEELERARRFNHPLSMIMLDLDGFKKVNDDFGHPTGDEVLREVGKLLKSHLRGIDIACRYGGEEFAALLPETPLDSAVMAAERLLAAYKHLTLSPVPPGRLSFSAGVATFPQDANSPRNLYEKADQALYRAKIQGRSRIVAASSR